MRPLSVKTLLSGLLAAAVAVTAAQAALPARAVGVTARAAQPAGPPARSWPVIGCAASPGQPAATVGLDLPGGRYLVPAACMRYLGHGLNMNLFGAAAMRQAARSGRLDVRISFTGRRPALPGVRIVRSGPGSAEGYVTTASARQLDRALSPRLLVGRVSVGLAGPATRMTGSAPARPDSPMRTLTVRATDAAGQPDTNPIDFVDLYNIDHSTWFAGQSGYDDGVAKFSVPAGHYWAAALFASPHWHFVVRPQFAVTGPTTLRLAYRDATSKITTSTPRPSGPVSETIEVDRAGRTGPPMAEALSVTGPDGRAGPGAAIWVSPASRPTIGTLRAYTSEQFGALPGYHGRRYVYDVAYPDPPGVIAVSHRHVVRPASLATVDARYYLDSPAPDSDYGTLSLLPGQLGTDFGPAWPFAMPRRQIEYMLTSPSAVWFPSEAEWPGVGLEGGQISSGQVYRAGEHLNADWNAYPLHPGYNVNLAGALNPVPVLPSASRSGNRLILDMVPFSDNQPGHTGLGFSAGRYQLDENGRQIAAGNALRAGDNNHGVLVRARLRSQPAAVRFTLTASRPASRYPLSGRTSTAWTWRTARGSGTLPPGWTCVPGLTSPAPRADRRCAVQPMLTLRYDVAGLALDGTAPAEAQRIMITAGHLPLARAARITGLRLQVSYDGGHRWRKAAVTGRGGQFTAQFTAPAGALITMRTRAVDAVGGSVSETITGAYRIAAATAAASPVPSGRLRAACRARPGQERYFAEYAPQAPVSAAAAGTRAAAPRGWSPRDLDPAYRLPVSRGSGQTVALSEAYRTPRLAADLAATAASTTCCRAPRPAAGCASSTRPAGQGRCPPPGSRRAGTWRPCWTCRWSPPPARTARSSSSRPAARTAATWPGPRTLRPGSAPR